MMKHGCCCHAKKHTEDSMGMYWRVIAAFLMLVGGSMGAGLEVEFFQQSYWRVLWYTVAYFFVGIPIVQKAWTSIREGECFNEFTLMVIATLGAFYIGEYPEGVAVMLFYTVGEFFQDKAVGKARKSIKALLDKRPEVVRVVAGENVEVKAPDVVCVGDVMEVKAGERVALDGILLHQSADFDASALTGESVPRRVEETEEVLAGMIVVDSVVRIKVSRSYEESALSGILRLVQEASERKAPAELFIRRLARVYTPVVSGMAMLVVLIPWVVSCINPAFHFVFQDWLYRALVFLVISCPCALVVSIPLGYFGGIGAASRRGILFKGSNYLDAIAQVNAVVFDKTGTLTKGVFEVQQVCSAGEMNAVDLVRMVASIEQQSNHPVAKAVVGYACRQEIGLKPVSELKERAGYGLAGRWEGEELLAGNIRLLKKYGVAYPEEVNRIAGTIVCCAWAGRYQGYLRLADTIKEDSYPAIKRLKKMGITNIHILSGDKQAIVSDVAVKLGVVSASGDLLPEEKAEELKRLESVSGTRIAFVGDGMNDAPVLAMSRVGIAMGGLGSDVAIETADVVIQDDSPSKVAAAVRIARYTRRIVRQNIGLALGIKLLVLLLGAGGYATLWEAVFADVGVALLAIGNAVRIQYKNFNL